MVQTTEEHCVSQLSKPILMYKNNQFPRDYDMKILGKPHFKNLVYRIIYKILEIHLRKMIRHKREPAQYFD